MAVGRVSGHTNLGNIGPQTLGVAAARLAARAGVKPTTAGVKEIARQDRAYGEAVKPSNVRTAVKQTRGRIK